MFSKDANRFFHPIRGQVGSVTFDTVPKTLPPISSPSSFFFLSDGLIIVIVLLLALLAAKWN